MTKRIQKRRLVTRSKLIAAAEATIASAGYGAMRVEEVVQKAQVAKGTFFAHFQDKEALMDHIIGARIDACLDDIEARPAPSDVAQVVTCLMPLMRLMTCERYVFDVILRHSGAAAKEEIGAIARTFTRQVEIMARWLADGPFRTDVPAPLLASGVQAFMVHAMALHFCAVHQGEPMPDRLRSYLDVWVQAARPA